MFEQLFFLKVALTLLNFHRVTNKLMLREAVFETGVKV
jgi:hypothetical protein